MVRTILAVPLTRMTGDILKPIDYLNFARQDIAKGNTRSLVNALSNIKRAIDFQLDILLEIYGLLRLSLKEKWSFPRKIDIIRKTGVVSPNILKLINSRRNQLEHHHRKPTKEEVMDFLDIAELFMELFKFRSHRVELLIDYDQDFAFWTDVGQGMIRIYDSTRLLWDRGGLHMFKETVKENELKPIRTIELSRLELWTEACRRYIRM